MFSQVNINQCADSSFRLQYTFNLHDLFITKFAPDSQNNFLFNGNQTSLSPTNGVLGKVNNEGKISWAKIINSPTFGNYIITDFASTPNIIYWAGSFTGGPYNPLIIKTDTSGNIISSFYYTINYGGVLGDAPITINKIKYYSNNEIYLLAKVAQSNSFQPYNIIMRVRNDGFVIWSQVFATGDGFNNDGGNCTDIFKSNNDLYVFGGIQNILQNNLAGIFTMKLNSTNGQLINISASLINLLHEANLDNYHENYKLANTNNGLYLISVINSEGGQVGLNTYRNKAVKIKLDSNFKAVNVLEIIPTTFNFNNLALDIDVNKNNKSCILFNNGNNYYYSLINDQNVIVAEKKINLPIQKPIGLNTKSLVYDNTETIYNFAQYDIPSYNQYEIFKVKGNWQNITSGCLGTDTQFVNLKNLLFIPYSFTWNSIVADIAQKQPINLTTTSFTGQEQVICKEVCICDTIKINGNPQYCLPVTDATFTIHKNARCTQKILWLIDTTAIKIIAQPNDTVIIVNFLKPYHGYIKATFDKCLSKDSFYIDVNTPKQILDLGTDTLLCPGKSTILDAGKGFKSYVWQDRTTTTQIFTATQPATYSVTTIDSCGNIFNDTITLKQINDSLSVNFSSPICLYDTAIITLNPKLINYTWTPYNDALVFSNTLKLFPSTTTLYTIKGQRFLNCTLSDTVLIEVINCPVYIYFPNAFTPNNDTHNDIFRPFFKGKFQQYQLSIYNRLGQLVFHSKNITDGWNGTFKGTTQDPATFVWYCNYKMENKPPKSLKGNVVLLR